MSGFFLGGAAEGIMGAQKQYLAERTLAQDTGLRGRGLDIQEKALQDKQQQQIITRVDQQISDTMAIVADTVKTAVAGGKPPDAIQKAIAPLVESAKQLAQRVGRDPRAIDAQAGALLVTPTAVQTAETKGTAAGVEKAAGEAAYDKAVGIAGGMPDRIRDPNKRAEVEGKMYDDYRQNPVVSEFNEVAGAKTRMDALPANASGDVALLYNFMRITNPKLSITQDAVASAANSGVLPKELQTAWNVMQGGNSTLANNKRSELKAAAQRAYDAQADRYMGVRENFTETARKRGLKPENVVGIDLRAPKNDAFASRFGDMPAPPPGFTVVPR